MLEGLKKRFVNRDKLEVLLDANGISVDALLEGAMNSVVDLQRDADDNNSKGKTLIAQANEYLEVAEFAYKRAKEIQSAIVAINGTIERVE